MLLVSRINVYGCHAEMFYLAKVFILIFFLVTCVTRSCYSKHKYENRQNTHFAFCYMEVRNVFSYIAERL